MSNKSFNKIVYKTNRQQQTLVVTVACQGTQKLQVRVDDVVKPFTCYSNRTMTVNRKQDFYIRMPQSPESALITVKGEGRGAYKIAGIKAEPLKTKLSAFDFKNKTVIDFVQFAQEFCEMAGIIDHNQCVYKSDNGRFRIDYLLDIRDRKTNRIMNTPSRISKSRGVIEVSFNKFKEYSIPMRMAILLHEFAHFYQNKKMSDETEADCNALLIYLGLGYSRSEAAKVFLKVFYKSSSDENRKRYNVIENMLKTFENNDYSLMGGSRYYYKNKY